MDYTQNGYRPKRPPTRPKRPTSV